MAKYKPATKIKNIIPTKDNIIVSNMNFKERITSSGIVLLGDDAKTDGIRPRWGLVHSVGPAQKDVEAGQWVLVEHGRWTRGVDVEINDVPMTIRKIDTKAILLVSDEEPVSDDTLSTSVYVESKGG